MTYTLIYINLRYCEKATKLEKNLPIVLTFTQYLTLGRFFQIFVDFSEKVKSGEPPHPSNSYKVNKSRHETSSKR